MLISHELTSSEQNVLLSHATVKIWLKVTFEGTQTKGTDISGNHGLVSSWYSMESHLEWITTERVLRMFCS